MKKTQSIPPIVGGCSLLVIFATLCLTIFSLLTVSTAKAELRLSEVSANAVSAYYQADAEAEQIFARIRCGDIPENVTVENSYYSYYCQISPSLYLFVQLYFNNEEWTVLSWKTVSSNR
jgi:hypothetical protein